MAQAFDQQSAAQANTSLVAAPGTGRHLVVKVCKITAGAATTCQIHANGGSALFGASSGAADFAQVKDGVALRLPTNKALEYTSVGTGGVSVYVETDDVPDAG